MSELGRSDSYVGTEGYIPPEGPGTREADIYSLGKLFYEVSTGLDRTDFPSLPVTLDNPETNAGLLELNAVFLRACARDRQDRYRSAEEMQGDLALLQSGKSLKRLRTIERRLGQATRAGLLAGGLLLLAPAAYLLAHRQVRLAEANFARAEEQRLRAERAEDQAKTELWGAYLAQARANRGSGQAGHRLQALAAIRKAVALRPVPVSLELRNEAIAALALTDVRTVVPVKKITAGVQIGPLDSSLERHVEIGPDGSVRLWDPRTGKPLVVVSGAGLRLPREVGTGLRGGVAFSRDGRIMAVAHGMRLVKLLDVASGAVLAALEHPQPQLISWIAFSPSGTHLAAATENHVIQLWNLRRLRAELAAPKLDWDQPALPDRRADTPGPLRLKVLSTGQGRRQKAEGS